MGRGDLAPARSLLLPARRALVRRLAGVALALAVLAAAPALTVSRLEERDLFCVSCHTTPEVTYYNRAQMALDGVQPALDLSSAHYQRVALEPELPPFRCIDCHRGNQSLLHRAGTLALGARDAVIWLAGLADPTIERTELVAPALLTGACTRCHAQALLVAGFSNHFHNKLPQAGAALRSGARPIPPPDWPAAGALPTPQIAATSVLCVDCHRAHIHTRGAEVQGYLDVVGTVYPACERCHRETGAGPAELGP